jgi:general secretion pathway protein G
VLRRYCSSVGGLTLIELIVTMTILAILASAVLPLARMTVKRTKELELRRNLRIMRTAIDDFKRTYDDGVRQNKIQAVLNKSGCPETLEQLVEGYDFGTAAGGKKRFLRKIPTDPFNPPEPGQEPKWGMRSYVDDPESTTWGGEDVFDVYSLSEEKAIDGTNYKDW